MGIFGFSGSSDESEDASFNDLYPPDIITYVGSDNQEHQGTVNTVEMDRRVAWVPDDDATYAEEGGTCHSVSFEAIMCVIPQH